MSDLDSHREILDALGRAIADLEESMSDFAEAYEQLDERAADLLEEQIFRPLQGAVARARRTHTDFARRQQMPPRAPDPPAQRLPTGAHEHVERAVRGLEAADDTISELQDSLLPVEYGDPELREGLADVRRRIATLPGRGREVLRVLGR